MWLHLPVIAPDAPRTPWMVDVGYSSLQAELAALMRDAGLEQVRYRNLSGGVAAIHSGWRL